MTDQDSPGFSVVDKRRAAQESSEDALEDVTSLPSESTSEPLTSSTETFLEDSPEYTTTEEAPDNQGYALPDPNMLLSMAAMQMDAPSLANALLPMFDAMAWRALGLIADPKTGEPQKDLPAAQLAIDCVHFFLSKVESGLSDTERRDAQRRLTDLRMNYLAKVRES